MNIVVPMAGRGKRFSEVGYKDPKPFIDVLGLPMISRIVDNLYIDTKATFTFICLEEFISKYGDKFKDILESKNINYNIVSTEKVTDGAACTVLLCKNIISNNDELIIANCDQLILDSNFMKNSVIYFRKNKADGGIICFLNDNPKWSYVRISGNKVIEVVEKQVVSNIATVGIYYYGRGDVFTRAAEHMINNNIRVNNEFFVSPTYNAMIVEGMNISLYLINEMVGLGTPEDLRNYITKNENV